MIPFHLAPDDAPRGGRSGEGFGGAAPPPAWIPEPDPLAAPAFAFCHDEGADADQLAEWCDLVPSLPPGVCPGLRATCASGKFEAVPMGCEGFDGGTARGLAHAPGEADKAWRPSEVGCDKGAGCSGGGAAAGSPLLAWGGAALVAALLFVVIRLVLAAAGRGATPLGTTPAASASAPIPGDDDLPLLGEDALLATAREHLEAGRLGDAVVHARGAALRRLARHGHLALHRARTDREYLRAAPETAREPLAEVLGAVEAHRWARAPLDAATARRAIDAATRLLAAVLLAVVAAPADAAPRRHAPSGDAALHALIRETDVEIVEGPVDLLHLPDDLRVLWLDAEVMDPSADELRAVLAWVERGNLLVLGGVPDDPVPALGTRGLFTGARAEVDRVGWLVDAGIPAPVWPSGPTYQLCDGALEAIVGLGRDAPRLPEAVRPAGAVDCETPHVIGLLRRGDGLVIAIADPRLLRNAALAVPENRAFLARLLRAGAWAEVWWLPERPRTAIATSRGTAGARDPTAPLVSARLAPFVAQLLVLWAVVALWRGVPLAPLRDPPDDGRRDFTEHLDALARHWAARGATRYAASRIAALALERNGAPGLRARARAAGYDAAGAAALVARAEDLVADPDGPDGPDDLPTLEALWALSNPRR